ncbi:hypothetical protein E2P42_01240 [Candidatus Bathyarchaeota archaeon]|nr:hypothetical protein E2P42_01240 [Candidatus Bathyarchaeota archaeon]
MRLRKAIAATLKSKQFWIWQLCGVIIYAIPVVIRYATGEVEIPILNFPGFWIWHFIPGNLLEKVLVNAFFPGGAGATTGEVFFSAYVGESVVGRRKYWFRLVGALGQTALWSAFQFWGYLLLIPGPGRGEGSNLFESIYVFPINFVLAVLSIFTPDVVGFMKRGISRLR